MAYQTGWSLIEISTSSEIESWVGSNFGETAAVPNIIRLPNGDHVHCPAIDTPYGDYKLVMKFSNEQPPDPGTAPPKLVAAAFNIVIANGDVQSIGGAFSLVAALYLDVGQYMLMFLKEEQDSNYVSQIMNGGSNIKVTEQETSFLVIEARNSNGEFFDPPQFGIQVYRF